MRALMTGFLVLLGQKHHQFVPRLKPGGFAPAAELAFRITCRDLRHVGMSTEEIGNCRHREGPFDLSPRLPHGVEEVLAGCKGTRPPAAPSCGCASWCRRRRGARRVLGISMRFDG